MKTLLKPTWFRPRPFIALFFAVFLLSSYSGKSQGMLGSAAYNLHYFFSGVNPVSNPYHDFLYPLSAHVVDTGFYQNYSTDTNYAQNWYRLYEEMRYMNFDTTALDISDSVYVAANGFGSDTVVFGFMDYDFYGLKDGALSSNTYFIFDTIADTIGDKPGRPDHPFTSNRLFAPSPLIPSSFYSQVTFRIDEDFFFIDSWKFDWEGVTLRIDYGDGNGFHNYGNFSNPIHEVVNYGSAGEKVLFFELVQGGSTVATGRAKFKVANATVATPPDDFFTMPGISVGHYEGCEESASRKAVVFVEGIDILDKYPATNRNVSQIYDEMIDLEQLDNLRNHGYEFYVIDWENSKRDIRTNAMYLVNFLDWLKCQIPNNQQFVVIGESMGGLCSQYALKYMESEAYMTEPIFGREACQPEQMHKTRLFMTFDSPHRGANIPLGVQALYRNFYQGRMGELLGVAGRIFSVVFEDWLASKATRQMLLFHLDATDGNGNYFPHNDFYDFQDEYLRPEFCKVMALSNGSMTGTNQFNFVTNQLRTAGDLYMHVEADLYSRVLGFTIPNVQIDLDVNTNPNGAGQVLDYEYKNYEFQIKAKWFGLEVGWFPALTINHQLNAQNLLPYCTSAGGFYGTRDLTNPGLENTESINWFVFSWNQSPVGDNCTGIDSHIGLDGFLSVNFDLTFCSDGMHFGFIPTASALGMQDLVYEPATDLRGLGAGTLLNNTPYDIIQGIEFFWNDEDQNRTHLNVRNDDTQSHVDGGSTMQSCGNDVLHLNTEIGDEVLYLNNYVINHDADFEAQYDIIINMTSAGTMNPNYEYPSGVTGNLDDIYSKENPFLIVNGAYVEMRFDSQNSPSGIGIDPNPPTQP
ncbi:MAG: esterase/lipase family protein [Owenweeksia sp.]